MKKKLTELVAWECRAQKLKPVKNKIDLEFIWQEKNKRRDKDNICFSKKFILDGLVSAGIIKNDGWQEIGSLTDRFKVADDYVVIVKIKEVE